MEMRHGSGFRALAALVLLGVIGLITAGAYGPGFTAGQASGTTSNLAPWAYGGAFGAAHLVGLVMTILVLILLFRLIAVVLFGGHRRAWGHHGHWHGDVDPSRFGPDAGRGGWHRSEWRHAGQAAFDEFHRQAHANQAATPGTTPGDAPGTTGADQPR
jgi:hypothetical protein